MDLKGKRCIIYIYIYIYIYIFYPLLTDATVGGSDDAAGEAVHHAGSDHVGLVCHGGIALLHHHPAQDRSGQDTTRHQPPISQTHKK